MKKFFILTFVFSFGFSSSVFSSPEQALQGGGKVPHQSICRNPKFYIPAAVFAGVGILGVGLGVGLGENSTEEFPLNGTTVLPWADFEQTEFTNPPVTDSTNYLRGRTTFPALPSEEDLTSSLWESTRGEVVLPLSTHGYTTLPKETSEEVASYTTTTSSLPTTTTSSSVVSSFSPDATSSNVVTSSFSSTTTSSSFVSTSPLETTEQTLLIVSSAPETTDQVPLTVSLPPKTTSSTSSSPRPPRCGPHGRRLLKEEKKTRREFGKLSMKILEERKEEIARAYIKGKKFYSVTSLDSEGGVAAVWLIHLQRFSEDSVRFIFPLTLYTGEGLSSFDPDNPNLLANNSELKKTMKNFYLNKKFFLLVFHSKEKTDL